MDGWRLAASPGTNSSHQWLLLIVWEQCRYHANCQDVVDVPEMLPEMASWDGGLDGKSHLQIADFPAGL